VNNDKTAAAVLVDRGLKSKLPLEMVGEIVAGPQVRWIHDARNTMSTLTSWLGSVPSRPRRNPGRDYFFPEIHDETGS
jgi:hypothetical protein